MKRRTSRRQVLNLNDNQDSPGHTWQTKYQQICAEHLSHHNRNTASKMSVQNISSGNSQNSNPLTDLVGHYNTDSESDDENKDLSSNKIDAKVSDFLKKIHETENASMEENNDTSAISVTVSSAETNNIKTQPPPPPPSAAMMAAAAAAYQTTDGQSQVQHPGMLWQECYDESSGYVYYWNMETNAVTWEMPPEYHAYVSASYDAQQWMYHQAMYQQHIDMSSYNVMSGYGYVDTNNEDNILTEENYESVIKKSKGKHKKKKKNEDDNEEIEMITSYGPASDDESDEIEEEEEKQQKILKKKKVLKKTKILSSKSDIHGPKTELHSNFGVIDEDASYYHSLPMPSFSNNVDDSVPPGMENIDEEIVYKNQPLSKHSNKNNASDSDIQKLKSPECNGDVKNENERLGIVVSPENLNTVENENDNTETDESLILSQLRNRAKVLKELGGDIPDEIKNLIDSTSDDISGAQNLRSDQEVIENSIKKELKPDETDDVSLLKKTEGADSEENNSPKATPFALIANYGDDSDTEEKLNNEYHPKKVKGHKEQLKAVDSEGITDVIFPITDFKSSEKHINNKSTSDTENKSIAEQLIVSENTRETKVKISELSLEKSSLIQSENTFSLDEKKSANDDLYNGVSESNFVDSSSNNRAFKRKKRLEVCDSIVSSDVKSTALADDKTSIVSVSSDNASVASGSATSYTTFTNYNFDPSSNERRGFGFQNTSAGDSLNFLDSKQLMKEEKSKIGKHQKRGMINFVKAETINLQQEVGKKKGTEEAEESSVKELNTKEDIQDLADSIMEKLKFLSEGENPLSPVLAMAIQVETLASAWHSGALIQTYFTNWLNEKGEDLNQLEQCAAPYGWACQWDRTYKRYYYVNLDTGETQWEYPEDCNAEGEEMDLCTTPPPLPTSVDEAILQPDEPPMPVEEPPKTPPPPPHISISIPSPPRPPKISEPEEKCLLPTKKRKLSKDHSNASDNKNAGTILSDDLPPLPPSSPPPLPPPPDDPPPLPPSPPSQAPSLPQTSLPSQRTVRGEPLPPGVDAPELPYIVSGPPPPPPPATPPMTAYQVPLHDISESVEYEATAAAYVDAQHYVTDGSYQHMGLTSMGLEYGPMAYMTAVSSSHTIERPATKNKASLFDELDSFYSDLATLECAGVISPPAISEPEPDVTDSVKEEETVVNVQEPQGGQTSVESEGETQNKSSETSDVRRKKKTKLVPALGLKKKGVSTLVAKWQQVQQEARRDYKNLDEDSNTSD